MPLRIGQIDYANCTPIFSAFRKMRDRGDYRFVKGVPSRLNRMLSTGEIDLCPSSSIEYGRSPGSYLLLPDLSISSIGPVKSVILFSRLPLENLDGSDIAVTGESAASVALLRIILGKYLGFTNRFIRTDSFDFSEALGTRGAVLMIGDTALRWRMRDGGFRLYDMGELWYSLTGLPFVFALWMIRAETVEAKPVESLLISKRLKEAKNAALSTLDSLSAECWAKRWMGRENLLSYWRTISYDLAPPHLEGVKLFFRCAHEIGILDQEPVLRFLGDGER